MPHYLRLRIVPPELAEQVEQRTFLGVGTGVGRGSRLIEAAFITDADAPVVPPGCMCADLVDGTATVEISANPLALCEARKASTGKSRS